MQLLYSVPTPYMCTHLMPHVTILYLSGAKLRLECSLLICKKFTETKILSIERGYRIVDKAQETRPEMSKKHDYYFKMAFPK